MKAHGETHLVVWIQGGAFSTFFTNAKTSKIFSSEREKSFEVRGHLIYCISHFEILLRIFTRKFISCVFLEFPGQTRAIYHCPYRGGDQIVENFQNNLSHVLSVADPEICLTRREGGEAMTRKTCGPVRRPTVFQF